MLMVIVRMAAALGAALGCSLPSHEFPSICLEVPPHRPEDRGQHRGSASVTRHGSPRSVLGNPLLNPIEKALFHLLAGHLALLKPEFASSRGARR